VEAAAGGEEQMNICVHKAARLINPLAGSLEMSVKIPTTSTDHTRLPLSHTTEVHCKD